MDEEGQMADDMTTKNLFRTKKTGTVEKASKQVSKTKGSPRTRQPEQQKILPSLEILASRNLAAPGGRIQLACNLISKDERKKPVRPLWKIAPEIPGVHVNEEGLLTVDAGLSFHGEIPINVVAILAKNKATKRIRLLPVDPMAGLHKINYFRFDGVYDGWNIWNWDGSTHGNQFHFSEATDFGVLAGVPLENMIIRYLNWAAKETWDIGLSGVEEIYVVEGDHNIHKDFHNAIAATSPKIVAAIMDSDKSVNAYLTSVPPPKTRFTLYMDGAKVASAFAHGKAVSFKLPEDYGFRPEALFQIKASKFFPPAKVTLRRVLDSCYYDGDDMGATFSGDKIALRLWAPTAKNVSLMIYDDGETPEPGGKSVSMTRASDGSGTWTAQLEQTEYYGKFYEYKLDFYPGTPFAKTTYSVDPYAPALGVNGDKGALIDPDTDPQTMPVGWKPDFKPPFSSSVDAVLYEVHVKDFSADEDSGVPPEHRGKFLAFAEKGTHFPGDPEVRTGVEHLKELGVTHVHLLPVYDFATVDETKPLDGRYNWGYDPKNYNAPEGSYSTNPRDPRVRIKEFRSMVQSLHEEEIRVVMDVVYNHTYNTATFDNVVPGYYYRSDRYGRNTNGSGCGNEVATERPMVRKFILDSLRHWVKTYNVDGFRFDLMGIIDVSTMKKAERELHQIDPTILIYGEPWGGGPSSLAPHLQLYKGSQKHGGFAVFNDNIRNAIRGNNDFPHPDRGYITGDPCKIWDIIIGTKGAIDDFAAEPGETINYAACHDNFVLWDQVISALGHKFPRNPTVPKRLDKITVGDEMFDPRVKRVLLAEGIVLTSQGIPFICGGDEFLRTKFGENNTYKSGDEINRFRWEWKKDYGNAFKYIKGLIQLRKSHPAFRMRSAVQVHGHMQTLCAPAGVLAYALTDHANGDPWRNIIVIANPLEDPQRINLPPGKWHVVVNDREAGTKPVSEGYRVFKGMAIAPPLSMLVLFDEERAKGEI